MEQFEKVIKGLESIIANDYPWGKNDYVLVCETALDLIRQQQERIKELEAGQTARVMTLEEVKDNEAVCLEDFTEPDDGVEPIIRPAINIEAKNGGIVMLDSATWDEGFIFVVDSEYGKTWRCWTQRPTDEQRKAVKWDER